MAVVKKCKKIKTTVYRGESVRKHRSREKFLRFAITLLVIGNLVAFGTFIKPFVQETKLITTTYGTQYTIPEATNRLINLEQEVQKRYQQYTEKTKKYGHPDDDS